VGYVSYLSVRKGRKTPEQKFIFQIGTLNPIGINERFYSANLFMFFSSLCSHQ